MTGGVRLFSHAGGKRAEIEGGIPVKRHEIAGYWSGFIFYPIKHPKTVLRELISASLKVFLKIMTTEDFRNKA
jgi:hypothetical protein